jgi:methylmalonyl-CoA mutase N-terminal domain/subunit
MTEHYSLSGIPIKQFYSPRDFEGHNYIGHVSDPGDYPYTRGRFAKLYGKDGWIQRELSGEGEPSRSNEQLKYLIGKGQTGIDVIGDSPVMAMMDPDHPLSRNTIGTQGVSLCCLQDYLELFKDLPLDSISVSSSVPPAFALTGLYLAAKKMGVMPEKLRGSVLQTPFYAEDCGYATHLPFDLRLRISLDAIEFAAVEMPRFHSFVEDTYFFSEVGLSPVEEMALGFVEIRHIVKKLLERGLDIDSFAPRIAILVNCGMDFFEEIAKIRATRRIFARMMRKDFGAKDPRSQAVVIAVHTSGLSLTASQLYNNITRGAIQALAMVMAGVQALEISAFDEAYRTPSPESHLIGLQTQQIINLETNTTQVTDPLGGSYYVESLTDDIEVCIADMIRDIESKGDPSKLIENGHFKRFFENSMERFSKRIASGEQKQVGVNVHRIPEGEDTLLKKAVGNKIEPCWGRIEKIKQFKLQRDPRRIVDVLQAVRDTAASNDGNLVREIMKSTAAGATMGEIAGVMRMAYGLQFDPYGLIGAPI